LVSFFKKGKTPHRFHLCIFPLLIAVPIFGAFTGGQQDRNILEPCASTETLSDEDPACPFPHHSRRS
jgi:hypothetical protein